MAPAPPKAPPDTGTVDDSLCGGPKRNGDGICTRPAGWGTSHLGIGRCKLHGGSSPSHSKAAARIVEERDARAVLEKLGAPEPIRHPVVELLDLAAEFQQWKTILRARVQVLEDLQTVDELGAERERAVVVLYERALDRCERVLVSLARLDLDARRFRLEEQWVELIWRAQQKAVGRLPVELQGPMTGWLAEALRDVAPPAEVGGVGE